MCARPLALTPDIMQWLQQEVIAGLGSEASQNGNGKTLPVHVFWPDGSVVECRVPSDNGHSPAAAGYARLGGDPHIPYPGMGTLDNGGVGSPTQFMLDMEIRKSQHALNEQVEVSEETLVFDEIVERIDTGESFLTSDHTLDHFRDLWVSELFPLSLPETADTADEERILNLCEERWRANVARYEPPDFLEDTRRALEGVLDRASKELL